MKINFKKRILQFLIIFIGLIFIMFYTGCRSTLNNENSSIKNLSIEQKDIKLAIIDLDTENGNIVDLLTVELSEQSNLIILERSEIERILTEHSISAANIKNESFRLGKLLGAGAVLCLNQEKKGKQSVLKFSLMAVNIGVVIKQWYSSLNLQEDSGGRKKVKKHIIDNLKKLKISQQDAIPISFMGISAMNPGKTYRKISALKALGTNSQPCYHIPSKWHFLFNKPILPNYIDAHIFSKILTDIDQFRENGVYV